MTAPLRRVLVRPPQPADAARWREYGWRAEPDAGAAAAEHEALREILEGAGAEVIVAEGERGNPDAIYAYDPVLVGEDGAVLLRPGKDGRLGEPGALEAALAQAGVPVAARIEAPGTIDGGDTLWLDRDTLLVGRGYRTNAAGVEQLQAAFPDAEVLSYDLPHWNGRAEVMHLMSLISPLDDDLALVYPRLAPVRLLELLHGARDRDRRGAGRGVRDDGPERPRARPPARARARGERRDAAADGGGRGRGARLQGRRDLPQGRRRPDVPDAADAARDEPVRGDRRRRRGRASRRARPRPGARERAQRGRALAGAARALQRQGRPRRAAPRREPGARRLRRRRGRTDARARGAARRRARARAAWSADGFTPLHYAAFFGQEDAAKLLLERGAEPKSSRATRPSS